MLGTNDAAILQHSIEQWKREIPDYVSKLEDKIISRKIVETRKVGAEIMWDHITHYERTGEGAQILAKGSTPKGSGSEATDIPFEMFQICDAFKINQKDLHLDPKLKSRDMNIILKNIHRKENIMAIRGDAATNIVGITGAAAANPNGVASRTDVWTSPTTAKYYNDILAMDDLLDPEFEFRWLVGNKLDLNKMNHLSDDTKQPIWKQIASLFGKSEADPKNSWQMPVGNLTLPQGKVYAIAQDEDAAEFVISENPALRELAMESGGNIPIEMFEWVRMEIHKNAAFVELTVN